MYRKTLDQLLSVVRVEGDCSWWKVKRKRLTTL